MHTKLSARVLAVAGLVCVSNTSGAATLDDVMARLDSLQRDNQAMRKEIAALRQKEQRSAPAQAVATRDAPSRQMSPEAASAMAADYPAKGRYVAPPQAFSWSGFYIGVHGGYGWGSSDWTDTSFIPNFTQSMSSSGVFGGIHAGANQQIGNWVLGLQADVSLIDAEARVSGGIPGEVITSRSKIDWLATFTGRFGYAFDRALLYVKGGVAGARFKDNWTYSVLAFGIFSDGGTQTNTRVGWTIGAGFEYALSNNWSASIEYNYLDFGTKEDAFVFTNPGVILPVNQLVDNNLQLVKLGFHYRF